MPYLTDPPLLRYLAKQIEQSLPAARMVGVKSPEQFTRFFNQWTSKHFKHPAQAELVHDDKNVARGLKYRLLGENKGRDLSAHTTSGKFIFQNGQLNQLSNAALKQVGLVREDITPQRYTLQGIAQQVGFSLAQDLQIKADKPIPGVDIDNLLEDLEELDELLESGELLANADVTESSLIDGLDHELGDDLEDDLTNEIDDLDDADDFIPLNDLLDQGGLDDDLSAIEADPLGDLGDLDTLTDGEDFGLAPPAHQKPPVRPKGDASLFSDLAYATERMAQSGSELSGLNLVSGAAQLGGLGYALGVAGKRLLEEIHDSQLNHRADSVLEQLRKQEERLQTLAEGITTTRQDARADTILNDLQAQDERIQTLAQAIETVQPQDSPSDASRACGTDSTRRAEPTHATQSTAAKETFPAQSVATPVPQSEPSTQATDSSFEPVERLFNQQIQQIEQALDPNAAKQPQSKPPALAFDPADTIETRLDKLEAYVKYITQKVDTLEAKFEVWKARQTGLNQLNQANPDQIANTPNPLADTLENFAVATKKLGQQRGNGDAYFSNHAFVRLDDHQTELSVQTDQGDTLFTAQKVEGVWVMLTDELSDSQKAVIAKLPQTPEEFLKQANGQRLFNTLWKNNPQAFEGNGGDIELNACVFEVHRDGDSIAIFGYAQDEPIFVAESVNGKPAIVQEYRLSQTQENEAFRVPTSDMDRDHAPQNRREQMQV